MAHPRKGLPGNPSSGNSNTLIDSTTSATLVSSVTDNAAGAITARTLAGGIAETRSFNTRNQLTQITAAANSATLLDIGYGYGTYNDGRIRSRTDAVQPEHSAAYSFDEIGRLTAVSGGDSSWGISWTLDRYGNRTAQTPSGLASGRVGQQTMASWTNNKFSGYQYDEAGNLQDDGPNSYFYDAESRIYKINSTDVQYAYDYAGRRVKRQISNSSGTVTTYYVYGLTGLMSEFSTSDLDNDAQAAAADDRLQYRVGEQTGTAVMLMDAGGVPRENNRVFPFGEPWLAFAGSNNNEKFTTYQHDNDAGTDLDYAMARYYASRLGRFMTPDPGHVGANVGDPQSWNAYVYALNNPINFTDPMGTECRDQENLEAQGLTCDYFRGLLELFLFKTRIPEFVDKIGEGIKTVVEMTPPVLKTVACVAMSTAGGALLGGVGGGVIGGAFGVGVGGMVTLPTGPGAPVGAGVGGLGGALVGVEVGLKAGAVAGGVYGVATCPFEPPTSFLAKGDNNGGSTGRTTTPRLERTTGDGAG